MFVQQLVQGLCVHVQMVLRDKDVKLGIYAIQIQLVIFIRYIRDVKPVQTVEPFKIVLNRFFTKRIEF